MTNSPRSASSLQKSSRPAGIWAVKPITSSSTGSAGEPNVSYSMVIPLACAVGIGAQYVPRRAEGGSTDDDLWSARRSAAHHRRRAARRVATDRGPRLRLDQRVGPLLRRE